MKKHLANIVTLIRIVLSPILYFCGDLSATFMIVYVICVLSDLLDGRIARKNGTEGLVGSTLDTLGDGLTYLGMMKVLITMGKIPMWFAGWFIDTLLLQIFAGIIARVRFGKFHFVHTSSSKILGGVMVLIPFAFLWSNGNVYLFCTAAVSTYSALEAIVIQIKAMDADADTSSVKKLKQPQRAQGRIAE